MSLLREFYEPPPYLSPGAIGFEDCESPFNRLTKKEAAAGKYLARHCLRIRRSSEGEKAGNSYWPLRLENLADGSTNVKSDMARLLRFSESGAFSQGILRPLRGSFAEEGGEV